ncbi:MAG: zf-HC2 domain-containing protein [Lachnospiraceae bacterium]|nr:zf-HC2 domain-containing protein [Lachnospiraceae bacterium]
MKCNEARRMVVPFIKKELSERDMEAFLLHIESCEDCMDELEMYFMVTHAINAMDSGEHHEYDFQKMLSEEIRTSKRLILRRKIMNTVRLVLLIAAELMLVLSIFFGVRMKQGADMDGIFERALLRMRIEQRNSTPEELESAAETETELETAVSDDAGTQQTESLILDEMEEESTHAGES